MNRFFPLVIQLAGAMQLGVAAANFFLPARLDYRLNLAKVSSIVRQIFIVHSLYIVLVLIGFGALCLFFPAELCGSSPLGIFLCGFLAVFWTLRVVLQFTYYDPATKARFPWEARFFGLVFLYLAVAFTGALVASLLR